jgi:hypothetical protein
MSQSDFEVLMTRIGGRFSKVGPRIVRARTSSRILRALGTFGLLAGRRRLLDYLRYAILGDLVRRNQIAGWELPPDLVAECHTSGDDIRLVLAALANPAFSFRTGEGIATATHLQEPVVAGILAKLAAQETSKPFSVWRGSVRGRDVFALHARRPGVLQSLPGIRDVVNWLDEPVIDPRRPATG